MFQPKSDAMLVITVGLLALFAMIPILAASTAEYTHTPLQGLILTNAHVIPGQETKASYILQSCWHSIRHAETQGLTILSGNDYNTFHGLVNSSDNPLGPSRLANYTEEWMGKYFTTPNAQLTVGLRSHQPFGITPDSNYTDRKWQQLDPGQLYPTDYYYEQNGKFSDLMPTPSTVFGFQSTDDYIRRSYGTYNIPFAVHTYNSYYRFAMPYAVRNDHMITVIDDILKPGGVYNSTSSLDLNDIVVTYAPSVHQNIVPTKTALIQQVSNQIANYIADTEFALHASDSEFDEIQFSVTTMIKASEWDATYTVTKDICSSVYPIDGSANCYPVCFGVPPICHTICVCDYSSTVGYIRTTAARIDGSCTIELDAISVDSLEQNGEMAATLTGLVTPEIEGVTRNDDIRINDRYNFRINYGDTVSTTYQTYSVSPYWKCNVHTASALSCDAVLYPAWYYALPENTANLAQEEYVYFISTATRKW